MGISRHPMGRQGRVLMGLATTLLIAGCPGTPTTPTSSQSGTPSAKPSAASPASPTAPTAPAASASPGSTPVPTAIPSTPDTSARATIHGVVYDAQGQRVSGATVTARILGAGTFANGSDTLTVATVEGSYALNGVPTGQTVLVTIAKDGFATRQRTIIALANLQGDPEANRLDFGGTGDGTYALAAGVEVIRTSPALGATGIDPTTAFTLTFSGPVQTADVEAAFALYVGGRFSSAGTYGQAADRYTLSALDAAGAPVALPFGYDLSLDDGAAAHTPDQVMPGLGLHRLYDSSAFTATWQDGQTVTFRFKPGYQLPTDKDGAKPPTIVMTLEGKPIRSANGQSYGPVRFRSSPVQAGTFGVPFTPAADTVSPRIVGVVGVNRTDINGNDRQDRIRVSFSEPMFLFPLDLGGQAIPALGATTSATRTAHYAYTVQTTPPTGVTDPALQALAGTATGGLEATDPSHQTVYLTPDSDDPSTAGGRGFTSGSVVWVRAGATMTDPAGNALDIQDGNNLRSGRAI